MKPVEMTVFCPACGGLVSAKGLFQKRSPGEKIASSAGLSAGAFFGSSIGVAGAFGAAPATVPLALIGAFAGYAIPILLRKKLECGECGTEFSISRIGRKDTP